MAFDQPTRNRLARFVSEARFLLTEEFTRQLQHEYGIDPASGEITAIEKLTALDDARRETARILRETVDYYNAGRPLDTNVRQEIIERVLREQAFTVLNRLCALRMAEARGILMEAVAQGYNSKGFQLYARLAGSSLGETGDAYRIYIFSLFDELAVELPPLFDRFNPQGRLFPREVKLLELLDTINDLELEPLWAEDETIGWIYQYFNSKEERQAMRAASATPRNSRELAVRNQFFTPRYVVEFLTDNTLGRIWYEMTRGQTRLKDICRYLLRRPNEIFLHEGEEIPAQDKTVDVFSQKPLINQQSYIRYRKLKDPRGIKMFDPACGSLHFGLYSYDIYELIYSEAWDLEIAGDSAPIDNLEGYKSLHDTYQDKGSFLRDVPRLIIEYNVHGVDIDARAVQIAGLSLWLRAQKSWQTQGVKPQNRPQIKKSNIVCAEPMPGDLAMLEESLATLGDDRLEGLLHQTMPQPVGRKLRTTKAMTDALAKLILTVWHEMKLAGEAGSLLKIEETLVDAIAIARKEATEKSPLFHLLEFGLDGEQPNRLVDDLDSAEQDFWDQAETLVLKALQIYAEQAQNGNSYRRHLFAGDASQGFAFIDLCKKRYDIVLMNPPFGSSQTTIDAFIQNNYEDAKNDLAAMFIQMGINRLDHFGYLGALTTRNILILGGYQNWRTSQLLQEGNLKVLADLGYGVLDDAMVEVSAYVVSPQSNSNIETSTFISCFGFEDKESQLQRITADPIAHEAQFITPQSFLQVPGAVVASNITAEMISRIGEWKPLEMQGVNAKLGLSTGEDERFLRTAWEVPAPRIGKQLTWIHLAKGGEWSPFWDDIHLLINWEENGKEVRTTDASIRNPSYFFVEGLTYPERTTSSFGPRILPGNCIFSTAGPGIFAEDHEHLLFLLGLFLSRAGQFLVELSLGSGDSSVPGTAARHYLNGMVNRLPFPEVSAILREKIAGIVLAIVNVKRDEFHADENSRYFTAPFETAGKVSILKSAEQRNSEKVAAVIKCANLIEELESLSAEVFGLSDGAGQDLLDQFVGPLSFGYAKDLALKTDIDNLISLSESELVSLAKSLVGLGKRYITKNCQLINKKYELVSHIKEVSVKSVAEHCLDGRITSQENLREIADELISYLMGGCFGRWNIQFAISKENLFSLPEPFSPLPACSPGMLQNTVGLPAGPQDVPSNYPLRISWSGILVNDEGHPEDVEGRVRDALHILWGEQVEAIESEACQILGVHSLREYFQKPTGFFAEHLSRYSKSRRQAPIYWPISTPSGSYTFWLYYHRLSDQILFTCVNDFVDPRLKQVSADAARLRQKKGRSAADEKELEYLTNLERELKDFRIELLRVAAFWKPNLNDGVEITAAPLWRLFQHKPWQKRLKETWGKLEAGEYDWAHLAYSIWPERVREKCKSDKSLAIAHDLEYLFVEPKPSTKKKAGRKKKEEPEMEGFPDED